VTDRTDVPAPADRHATWLLLFFDLVVVVARPGPRAVEFLGMAGIAARRAPGQQDLARAVEGSPGP